MEHRQRRAERCRAARAADLPARGAGNCLPLSPSHAASALSWAAGVKKGRWNIATEGPNVGGSEAPEPPTQTLWQPEGQTAEPPASQGPSCEAPEHTCALTTKEGLGTAATDEQSGPEPPRQPPGRCEALAAQPRSSQSPAHEVPERSAGLRLGVRSLSPFMRPAPEQLQPAAAVAGSRTGACSSSLFPKPAPMVLEGPGAVYGTDRGISPESSSGHVLPKPPLPQLLQPAVATAAAAGPSGNPVVQFGDFSGLQQSGGWGQMTIPYTSANLWHPGTSVAHLNARSLVLLLF